MLKYLIIPLAKDSVSFCHYNRGYGDASLIEPEMLKKAIFWAMKENLTIQFLYPDIELPSKYKDIIESIDHASIVSATCEDSELAKEADIIVLDSWASVHLFPFNIKKNYVIRTSKCDLFENARFLADILRHVNRLVIVITDPESFTDEDFIQYGRILDSLVPIVAEEYKNQHAVHFNLLTDRILLDEMNNCNAGFESITLAPDGKFYICPAFYIEGSESVGDLENGIDIKNPQLYRLDHAPICRNCDAYQCHRCVWINRRTTLEVNTPSHEQCVIAHIERNSSRRLLEEIRKSGVFMPDKEINSISYMDPFETIIKM